MLPDKLQRTAIELAHRGAHPGQSGLARRLRYHFFFHGMTERIENLVLRCQHCNVFVDKKTFEPIKHHVLSENNWDHVAVDLYGRMPSSKHAIFESDAIWPLPRS